MPTEISASILDGTMTDAASVAELFRRQKHFTADTALTDSALLRGQDIFNTALFTHVPDAKTKGRPVVEVLRWTIEEIGRIYAEGEKQEVILRAADEKKEDQVHAEYEHDTSDAGKPPEVLIISDDEPATPDATDEDELGDDTSDESSFSPEKPLAERVAAALEARHRRRRATHDPARRPRAAALEPRFRRLRALHDRRPRVSAAAAVVGALRRNGSTSAAGTRTWCRSLRSKTRSDGTSQSDVRGLRRTDSTRAAVIGVGEKIPRGEYWDDEAFGILAPEVFTQEASTQEALRSLIVKLKMPASYFRRHREPEQIAKPSERKGKTKITRRSRKSKVKSDEFVTSDLEDEGEENEVRRSPRSTELISTPAFSSRSIPDTDAETEDADIEMHDASTEQLTSTLDNAQAPTTQRTSSRSTKRLPSSSISSTSTSSSPSPSSSTSHPSTSPSSIPPPSITKLTTPPTIGDGSSDEARFTFPPFPPLSPRAIEPFHLGARIALENIREDWENGSSLSDILHEYISERPVVEDCERKTRVMGGGWVCEVLGTYCGDGEMGEEEEDGGEDEKEGSEEEAGSEMGVEDESVEAMDGADEEDVIEGDEDEWEDKGVNEEEGAVDGEELEDGELGDEDDMEMSDEEGEMDEGVDVLALVAEMEQWVESEKTRLSKEEM